MRPNKKIVQIKVKNVQKIVQMDVLDDFRISLYGFWVVVSSLYCNFTSRTKKSTFTPSDASHAEIAEEQRDGGESWIIELT